MPDMSKVRANDHDKCYTPLEARRRAEMRIKPAERYGFYRVATECTPQLKCSVCMKAIHGANTIINGRVYCNRCLVG